ncbi:MAG: hypothetical protein ACD_62C00493G0003 [uncultured bacterium]|nr:MAG: hypothetical protein ACD_62C00493G0003 [uncultured bacterium]HLD44264.1 transposase [bacterium]
MTDKDNLKLLEIGRKVRGWVASDERRRRWPEEIKTDVVALIRQGFSMSDLSRTTGIYCATISKWRFQKKKPGLFSELALVLHPRIVNDATSEISLETARGHFVSLPLSALSALFQAGVL